MERAGGTGSSSGGQRLLGYGVGIMKRPDRREVRRDRVRVSALRPLLRCPARWRCDVKQR